MINVSIPPKITHFSNLLFLAYVFSNWNIFWNEKFSLKSDLGSFLSPSSEKRNSNLVDTASNTGRYYNLLPVRAILADDIMKVFLAFDFLEIHIIYVGSYIYQFHKIL